MVWGTYADTPPGCGDPASLGTVRLPGPQPPVLIESLRVTDVIIGPLLLVIFIIRLIINVRWTVLNRQTCRHGEGKVVICQFINNYPHELKQAFENPFSVITLTLQVHALLDFTGTCTAGLYRYMHRRTYRRLWSSSVRSPCGPPADWTAVTSPEWPASPYCLSARCTGTGPCHGFSVKPKHKHQSAVTTYTPQDNLYKTSQVQQSSYLKGGKHTFSRKDNQKLNALHIK